MVLSREKSHIFIKMPQILRGLLTQSVYVFAVLDIFF
jgi:hypothetical protein